MSQKERIYMCIDMKSFYASVECAERNLNPFETNLVVADTTRGENALCLAITPKMKAQGIKNRCRLSDIPRNVKYEAAMPRMQLYIEYAADIYALYLNYFDPRDIHVYSIDESFIDATHYLESMRMTPQELAKKLMNEIAEKLHIPSTAGIGTNLYLAKIALDITAKHTKDHLGYLTEELYQKTLLYVAVLPNLILQKFRGEIPPAELIQQNPTEGFLSARKSSLLSSKRQPMTSTDLVPIMPIDNNLAPEHKSIAATFRKDALFQNTVFFFRQLRQQALELWVNY